VVNKRRIIMEKVLGNLQPEDVFMYFEDISNIPRASFDEKAVAEYCMDFAHKHGLWCTMDEKFNVIIKKPATPGKEDHTPVILQGHLDMVCEKNLDVEHDFTTEPLKLYIDGDYIYAKGTTLGGDNGIAVAISLAILADDSLTHPEIEAIFTTGEEIGLEGAIALDTSDLNGKYMINLDSEEEGEFVVSCAGGKKTHIVLPITKVSKTGEKFQIIIKGLLGGHSGMEIDKCRANANVLMGRLTNDLKKSADYSITKIFGGLKDNAIPRESVVELITNDSQAIKDGLTKYEEIIKNEYKTSDKGITIEIKSLGTVTEDAFDDETMKKILDSFMLFPNGIQTMSADIKDLPESSLNFGVLINHENSVEFVFALRSSVKSLKNLMHEKLEVIANIIGATTSFVGEYPEWEYKPDSKLRDICVDEYNKLFGQEAIVKALHCGLESGVFAEKMEGLDIISFGPNIFDVHTPKEHLSISSTERTYKLIVAILATL
jgi:dipeptidase D